MGWAFFFKYIGGGWLIAMTLAAVLAVATPSLPSLANLAIGGTFGLAGMWLGGEYGMRREFPTSR